jgi:uncharacterized protein (TIGR00255 family)
MLQSMTGFGSGRSTWSKGQVTVELRSLNNKFTEISLKMPQSDSTFEQEVRNLINKELIRGKIMILISEENSGEPLVPIELDLNKIKALLAQFEKARKLFDLEGKIKIKDVLNFPDIYLQSPTTGKEEKYQAYWEALREAIVALKINREAEGSILAQDLILRCKLIDDALKAVPPFEENRIKQMRNKFDQLLKEHISQDGINRDRFEQELIFYIEKLDITEEKIRLKTHLDYFKEVMEKEEYPGKKLGFITQEIGREINTLGAKANDASIQRLVVGMKDELEKMKEQLSNIV